jgi:branched-chain amino acid aminotransferase
MPLIEANRVMRDDPSGERLPHDKEYEDGSAFANGQYCAASQAMMPLFDMGFIQSDATYEKATVSKGRYFRLLDHFDRFARSCEKFRLRSPYTNEEMLGVFNELLRLTGLREAGVWWCVTRGLQKEASDRGNPAAFENRFYAAAFPYTSIATDAQRAHGLDLIISERHIRIPPKALDPRVKNFNQMDMKLSLFEATDRGKDWSVLTDAQGYLTEPAGANIFVVKGGQLYTPDSGCLEGITRKSTLELAEMLGIPTHVEKVHARHLREADDAFITSSAGGIMPVNSVDGVVLGGVEGPGELTARLHDVYWKKMWEGWKGTPVDYT